MKLEDVQSYAADRIAAVPALSAFGDAIQFSPFLDDATLKTQISARLLEKGVCIEIGGVEATRVNDNAARGVAADASFDVYVAESLKVTHVPSDKDLRKAVIEAVTVMLSPRETRAEFASSDTAISESGYVLHILSFTMRVTIP